jgi:thiamine biosynthesis protein ThiS
LPDKRALRSREQTQEPQAGVPGPADAAGALPDPLISVRITLNGERYELDQPVSVVELLTRLEIDPRRVAIEHNLSIIKRHTFSDVIIADGDTVEIVNFVGGG